VTLLTTPRQTSDHPYQTSIRSHLDHARITATKCQHQLQQKPSCRRCYLSTIIVKCHQQSRNIQSEQSTLVLSMHSEHSTTKLPGQVCWHTHTLYVKITDTCCLMNYKTAAAKHLKCRCAITFCWWLA